MYNIRTVAELRKEVVEMLNKPTNQDSLDWYIQHLVLESCKALNAARELRREARKVELDMLRFW